MTDPHSATVTIHADDFELLSDALRFARDELVDEDGLSWSDDQYSRLQNLIDALEPLIVAKIASG